MTTPTDTNLQSKLKGLLQTIELAIDMGDYAWAADAAHRLSLLAAASTPRSTNRS